MLIPEENAKDLQDIPENVKNGLEIVPVKWIDKVLEIALEKPPTPLSDEEVAASAAAVAEIAKRATRRLRKARSSTERRSQFRCSRRSLEKSGI